VMPDGTPVGKRWLYRYDIATQQLREIDAPPPVAGAARLTTSFTYDPATGNLASVTDGIGHTVTYVYDPANGNLLTERDGAGDTITRTYDAAGRMVTETHYRDASASGTPAQALTIRYVYDPTGKLRFLISPEGRVTEYRYGTGNADSGLITQTIQYAGGEFDLSQYGPASVPSESVMAAWAGGQDLTKLELTQLQYDLRGNLSQRSDFASTDALGNGVAGTATTTTYVYDSRGELRQAISQSGSDSQVTSMAYDGMGRLIHKADAGGSETIDYDDADRKIKVTANHGVVSGTGLVTVSSYDTTGRLTSLSQSSDDTARQTLYFYDAIGRLTMVQDPAGGRSFTFYDDADRILYSVDAAGGVTGFTYNDDGSVKAQTVYATAANTASWTPDKAGLAAGTDFTVDPVRDQVTGYTYDDAGRLKTKTDPAGVVTTMYYDGQSQLVKQVTEGAVLRYIYDGDGNMVGTVDEEGYLTETVFDSADSAVQTIAYATRSAAAADPDAPVESLADWRPAAAVTDQHTYDYYDGEGRAIGHIDAHGFLTGTVYDDANHEQQDIAYKTAVVVGPDDTLDSLRARAAQGGSETTTTDFDDQGRVAQVTAPDQTVTTYEYDDAGRLVRQVYAAGTSDERATRTRYDGFDDVTGTLGGEGDAFLASQGGQPAGPTPEEIAAAFDRYGTQYVYDALGNAVEVIAANATGRPEDRHVSVTFRDADGRPVYTVDAAGDVTKTEYDGAGQVRKQTQYGMPLDPTLLGELVTGTKGVSDLVLALTAQPADPPARVTTYDYDARGLLTRMTDPMGFVTTSTYDDLGRLASQTRTLAAGQTVTTTYGYDLKGELTAVTDDAGGLDLVTRTRYDAFGRVTDVTDAAGNTTHTDYGHDSGRTVEVTDPLGRVTRTEYDFAERVLKVTDAVNMVLPADQRKSTTYTYDDVNRKFTVTTPEGISVVTTNTRLGQTLSVTDGRGNTTTYTYNRDGQLLQVDDALHDADHPLVLNHYRTDGLLDYSKDARGIYTTYTYDALNRVLERRVDPKKSPATGTDNPGGLDEACSYQFDAFGGQTLVTCGSGDLVHLRRAGRHAHGGAGHGRRPGPARHAVRLRPPGSAHAADRRPR